MPQLVIPEHKRIRDEAPDSKRFVVVQWVEDGVLKMIAAKHHNGVWTTAIEKVKFRAEDIPEHAIWFESPLQAYQQS